MIPSGIFVWALFALAIILLKIGEIQYPDKNDNDKKFRYGILTVIGTIFGYLSVINVFGNGNDWKIILLAAIFAVLMGLLIGYKKEVKYEDVAKSVVGRIGFVDVVVPDGTYLVQMEDGKLECIRAYSDEALTVHDKVIITKMDSKIHIEKCPF